MNDVKNCKINGFLDWFKSNHHNAEIIYCLGSFKELRPWYEKYDNECLHK